MKKYALIKGDYRYSLIREWDSQNPRRAVFMMLNPSTADDLENDQTTNKCITFAKSWNCGSLEIVNVYAYRSTNYQHLKSLSKEEATGLENEMYIENALKNATIRVAAWGRNVTIHHPDYKNLEEQLKGYRFFCLGKTKDGHPRHPLYVKNSTQLEVFNFKRSDTAAKKMHINLNLRRVREY
jgi:hypothetical protein